MIRSMTGYGKGEYEENGIKFAVEIKSVNHRYSDLSIKIPRTIFSLEEKVREFASALINRGKVDIYINYDSFGQDVEVKLDTNLAKSYIECLNGIKNEFSIKDDISLSLLARFPDIIKVEKVEKEEDALWNVLKIALQKAFSCFIQMREREGERLYKDIWVKILDIESMIDNTYVISKNTVEIYRDKLYQKIKDLTNDISLDENRLMTEVAIIADKSCIDEELVRLRSHIAEFKKTIGDNFASGKKLDFIIQEMNREINTIGSKANELRIINNVVNIKSEIEKIREQVQNIE